MALSYSVPLQVDCRTGFDDLGSELVGPLPWMRREQAAAKSDSSAPAPSSSEILSDLPRNMIEKRLNRQPRKLVPQEEQYPRFVLLPPVPRQTKPMPDRYPRFVQTSYFYDRLAKDAEERSKEVIIEMSCNSPTDFTEPMTASDFEDSESNVYENLAMDAEESFETTSTVYRTGPIIRWSDLESASDFSDDDCCESGSDLFEIEPSKVTIKRYPVLQQECLPPPSGETDQKSI